MRAWLVFVMMLVLGCGAALAHPMPNTIITLDAGEAGMNGEITIPLIELDLALGSDLSSDPATRVPQAEDQIATYLSGHMGVTAPDGNAWDIAIGDIVLIVEDEALPYAEIVAGVTMTPPSGASAREFTLAYDAVMERVVTHYAVVSIRRDWLNGQLEGSGEALGVIRVNPVDGSVAPLSVTLSNGSYWTGFLAMLGLGASHIAEGTDHLLFLLTLLLPAPLLARGRRWGEAASLRATLLSIAAIVTAFTLGHSVALIVASLSRLHLPQQPIEIIIALTILISAVHALRPLFPRREWLVAGLFGLIHGMAFSFTLAELDLSTPQLVVSLLGFNLGIELFQLLIVALTLPALLLFARSGTYAPVRIGGAVLAIVASLGWLMDRLGWTPALATLADDLGQQLPWAILALTLCALVTWMLRHNKT